LNYAVYLEDNDSLTYNYAIYKNSEELVEYQEQLSSLEDLEKRFVIVNSNSICFINLLSLFQLYIIPHIVGKNFPIHI
jgi:hypothetical protein